MPRVVDHRARRAEIVYAVIDLVATRGRGGADGAQGRGRRGRCRRARSRTTSPTRTRCSPPPSPRWWRAAGPHAGTLPADADPADLLYQALLAPLPLTDARRAEARVWLAFLDRALVREEATELLRQVYAEWRRQVSRDHRARPARGPVPRRHRPRRHRARAHRARRRPHRARGRRPRPPRRRRAAPPHRRPGAIPARRTRSVTRAAASRATASAAIAPGGGPARPAPSRTIPM